jgi:hypothetical protein
MIPSPWRFEPDISDQDLAKLGILTLRWSHIEHTLGNCLKVMLRLTDDEAAKIIFPQRQEWRANKIAELIEINTYDSHAVAAFQELRPLLKGLSGVRANIVHAVAVEHDTEGHIFHLRSKQKSLTRAEIFSCEELINYAAHLVRAFRYALGFKGETEPMHIAWPDRPEIPEFLRSSVQYPKAKQTAAH